MQDLMEKLRIMSYISADYAGIARNTAKALATALLLKGNNKKKFFLNIY
jgi:hypothetical protein